MASYDEYEYEDVIDKYYNKWLNAKSRADRLENGPGGIMEMKQTIADKEAEIARLEAALRYATEYAGRLAIALSKQHYPEAYEFKLVPDLLGIIDQIDHMTYNMIRIGTQSNDTFEVK